jgi:serine/threonine-protein phosphatase 2A regulatory subunit B
MFGDSSLSGDDLFDEDTLTCLEFNEDGDMFAVGDQAGRVSVYQQSIDSYASLVQFQSHEPEFDFLKSEEIPESINALQFLKRQSESVFVLSANGWFLEFFLSQSLDKTIKLWKIKQKRMASVSDSMDLSRLSIPSVEFSDWIYSTSCRQVYFSAHEFPISSLSLNTDNETFISSDYFRINLWNFNAPQECFSNHSGESEPTQVIRYCTAQDREFENIK